MHVALLLHLLSCPQMPAESLWAAAEQTERHLRPAVHVRSAEPVVRLQHVAAGVAASTAPMQRKQ